MQEKQVCMALYICGTIEPALNRRNELILIRPVELREERCLWLGYNTEKNT